MSRLLTGTQYLQYSGSNLLGAVGTAEPLSVSLWIKVGGGDGNSYRLGKLQGSHGFWDWRIDAWDPGVYGRTENNLGAVANAYKPSVALGAWRHLLFEFASGTSRTTYADNVAGTENTTDATHSASMAVADVVLGPFVGTIGTSLRIAEFAFWKKVLSGAERTTLQTQTPNNVAGAVAYWPLTASLADAVNGWTLADMGTASSFDADHPTLSGGGGGGGNAPRMAHFARLRRRSIDLGAGPVPAFLLAGE
jgi:hypothetical protein